MSTPVSIDSFIEDTGAYTAKYRPFRVELPGDTTGCDVPPFVHTSVALTAVTITPVASIDCALDFIATPLVPVPYIPPELVESLTAPCETFKFNAGVDASEGSYSFTVSANPDIIVFAAGFSGANFMAGMQVGDPAPQLTIRQPLTLTGSDYTGIQEGELYRVNIPALDNTTRVYYITYNGGNYTHGMSFTGVAGVTTATIDNVAHALIIELNHTIIRYVTWVDGLTWYLEPTAITPRQLTPTATYDNWTLDRFKFTLDSNKPSGGNFIFRQDPATPSCGGNFAAEFNINPSDLAGIEFPCADGFNFDAGYVAPTVADNVLRVYYLPADGFYYGDLPVASLLSFSTLIPTDLTVLPRLVAIKDGYTYYFPVVSVMNYHSLQLDTPTADVGTPAFTSLTPQPVDLDSWSLERISVSIAAGQTASIFQFSPSTCGGILAGVINLNASDINVTTFCQDKIQTALVEATTTNKLTFLPYETATATDIPLSVTATECNYALGWPANIELKVPKIIIRILAEKAPTWTTSATELTASYNPATNTVTYTGSIPVGPSDGTGDPPTAETCGNYARWA